MTYTVSKVLEIMKDYHIYKRSINDYRAERKSVGVSHISDMPSAGTLSDVVADEALTNVEGLKAIAEMQTDCKYLEDRLHRVSDSMSDVLDKRMRGYSAVDIAQLYNRTEWTAHKWLNNIAKQITGY